MAINLAKYINDWSPELQAQYEEMLPQLMAVGNECTATMDWIFYATLFEISNNKELTLEEVREFAKTNYLLANRIHKDFATIAANEHKEKQKKIRTFLTPLECDI